MFILKYWSLGHFISILLPIAMIVACYFILRNRSQKTQKIVILVLILLNVLQHLLKPWVWYPLFHGVFNIRSISFYNVCATMILLSPVVFLCKSKGLKDALFFLGNLGGIMSLWFITIEYGVNILTVEFSRYFLCHAILMMTSTLPVLLGLHTLSLRNFWKVGLCFLALEAIVFVDNFIIYLFRNGFDWGKTYNQVYTENEIFICHAADQDFLKNTFLRDFHPKYVIDDGTCFYIPILWSAWAIYPVMSGFVFLVMWLLTKAKLNNHYLAEKWKKKEENQ